jgi:hypothetical protein
VDAQPRAEIWYLDAARRVPEAITAKCPLCNCTWDVGRGVDALHPGAQAYYDSLVQLYAGWGVDLIKVDRRRRIRVRRSWPSPRFARLIAPWCSRPGGGMAPESAAWVADYAGGHKPMGSSPVGYPTKFTTADISIATSDVTAALAQQATMYRVTGDFHSRPLEWIDGLGEHVRTHSALCAPTRTCCFHNPQPFSSHNA